MQTHSAVIIRPAGGTEPVASGNAKNWYALNVWLRPPSTACSKPSSTAALWKHGCPGRHDRFASSGWTPHPGGSYRLMLTYTDPRGAPGKSSTGSDIVEVRYLDMVPNHRVVQAVDFVADEAKRIAGTMTMTSTLRRNMIEGPGARSSRKTSQTASLPRITKSV